MWVGMVCAVTLPPGSSLTGVGKRVDTVRGTDREARTAVEETAPQVRVGALALELTRYCNQKCDYCYNEFRDAPAATPRGEDRWPARVKRLLSAFDIGHVTLTGGEPMAYRGVFDLLGMLRASGVPTQLISNGGLFDDALAARLATFSPRSIQVTLNADTPQLHDELVGGAGHFERTLRGIAALRRHAVTVVGCMVVNRKNAHRTAEVLARFRELGVQQVALSRFSPAGYSTRHAAKLLPGREHLLACFEAALPFAKGGMRLQCTMPVPPCAVEVERYAPIRFGGCAIGTSAQEFAVGPDGRMRNCTLHGHVISQAGDVADPAVDLHALVRSNDVTGYRRKIPPFCRGCLYEDSCAGGCGAAASWVHSGVHGEHPDPFVGQYVDEGFARALARVRSDPPAASRRRRLDVIL